VPNPAAPSRTSLSTLKLSNFRNYASLSLDLDERSVALVGPNGAGKTNLLEAVSFLSPGRGLRRAALEDVARRPGDRSWAVAVAVSNVSGAVDIGTGLALGDNGPETRRAVRINHAPARSADALLEHLRVVWLTPSMDGLFTGPAGDRRRFLDRAVFAIDRQHGTRVNAFERAMRGRNKLLSENPNAAWLTAIETEMAALAVAIAAARREWARLATALIDENGGASVFPTAGIALEGTLEHGLADRPAGDVEDQYRLALAADRPRDAAAGRTLAGPHLSDLRIRHQPKDAPAETCSTGEQKALLIGLVLAQASLATKLTGETPIVLLDELAAHLDETRREALFRVLDDLGCQTFMTGTDVPVFGALGGSAQMLAVDNGHIEPISSDG
jgi:DNA replication and repair protein RecF